MKEAQWRFFPFLALLVGLASLFPPSVHCIARHYKFNVVMTNTTRMCSTKPIVTVNGHFPGPTLVAREGDNILVKVVNYVNYNLSIHWHGVRQLRSGWADGPAYVTQCPIQPGQSYVYNFTLTGQRGTLLWHAHILWLRATVHGAILILPKLGVPYPFPKPHKEKVLILGEWWKADIEELIRKATEDGIPPNVSDAHTINGRTGPVPRCASQGGVTVRVQRGRTYLLRLVNAALNEQLFFKIADHSLTVVEVDASYTKPFAADTVVIAPGQTTNVLLKAKANALPGHKYIIGASPFVDSPIAVDNFTATAILTYVSTRKFPSETFFVSLPGPKAAWIASNFSGSLRSLNSREYPARVPLTVHRNLLFTMGIGINPCRTCLNGKEVVADFNNVTFELPKISLIEAHYFDIPGVFTDDFPGRPLNPYDFAGTPQPANLETMSGTRVYRIPYNTTVQLILQGTRMVKPDNHPIHLHGFNFFEVGRGLGNFNPESDPKSFNVVDPVERNTIGVPSGGWSAIRFRADNPGVWFLHCHLELHTTWGLAMAFIVDNGKAPDQFLLPPPKDLPRC